MNPYATHLPVLRALGKRLRIGSVLEFGCGLYSTLEFLNRQSFPYLFVVDSVEEDVSWRGRILQEVRDSRLIFLTGAQQMARRIDAYDLIFIDNGRAAVERVPVIRMMAEAQPRGVVVIHDYEAPAYQEAARGFEHRLVYDALTPHTAVLWNGCRPDLTDLW